MAAPAKPGPGRPKGAKNKATAEIKELAQAAAPEAMAELTRLAKEADNETTRVSAIKEILDRGYGKAPQSHEVTGKDGSPIQVRWLPAS